MTKTIPEGWHSVTPRIVTQDVEGLVAFIKHTFKATGEFQATRPSEIRIGDSTIMVSGIDQREAFPAFLYVYVDDADATYQRAIDGGATSLEEPQDMPYGDRRGMVKDAWANIWQIAQTQR